MGLVTILNWLMTTGSGTTEVHVAAGIGLGEHCNINAVQFVGQVSMTFVPERRMANCGGETGNVKLNNDPGDPRKPT